MVEKKESRTSKKPQMNKAPEKPVFDKEAWKPRTSLGQSVKKGVINDIDRVLDKGFDIREAEVVDVLMPSLETDLLLIGQSKGKFGGGARRVFKQTQKKTMEGNKPSFATYAVVGDRNGHVGLGYGKCKETVPAREKAFRTAKTKIIKILRGCGSWACGCSTPHSIPFAVEGRCGSVEIKLIPAPKGTGLCVEKECSKILALAGIKDVWVKSRGHTTTKTNLVGACFMALEQLAKTKIQPKHHESLGVAEGSIEKEEIVEQIEEKDE